MTCVTFFRVSFFDLALLGCKEDHKQLQEGLKRLLGEMQELLGKPIKTSQGAEYVVSEYFLSGTRASFFVLFG